MSYLALVLRSESVERFRKDFPALHDTVSSNHVTIWYKPDTEVMKLYAPMLGREYPIETQGYFADSDCQVVSVTVPMAVENKIPHITISYNRWNTQPKYSNDKLMANENKLIKVSGIYYGTLELVP